jgi:predicted nucleotidyltransferase
VTIDALILNNSRPLSTRLYEFIRNVEDTIHFEKAFLFGSTAKGTRRAESDVDLMVVSEGFKDLPELKRSRMLLDLWSYVEELQILTYIPEEFEQVKDRFMMQKILQYVVDLTPKMTQQKGGHRDERCRRPAVEEK